jgi:hypothetical protein
MSFAGLNFLKSDHSATPPLPPKQGLLFVVVVVIVVVCFDVYIFTFLGVPLSQVKQELRDAAVSLDSRISQSTITTTTTPTTTTTTTTTTPTTSRSASSTVSESSSAITTSHSSIVVSLAPITINDSIDAAPLPGFEQVRQQSINLLFIVLICFVFFFGFVE